MIRSALLIPAILVHELSEVVIDLLTPVEEFRPHEVANEHIDAWIDEQYARRTNTPWWQR